MTDRLSASDAIAGILRQQHPGWTLETCDGMARTLIRLPAKDREQISSFLGNGRGPQDENGLDTEDRQASGPRIRLMAEVEPEEVRWLWDARIPRGKLSEIVGDPGEGKSWLTMQLVGLLTSGRPLPGDPDFDRPREKVLLLSAEDGAGDTIRPRLDAAGADVARVHLLEGIQGAHGALEIINLHDPLHRLWLSELVSTLDVTLVVIDPLAAYLGETDSNQDSKVRGVLAPLAEMAERTGAAVVAIRHLTKGSATRAIYRAGGSIGFTGSARSSLLVGRVDEDSDERAILVIKSNLAAFPPPVGFQIGGAGFRWTGTPDVSASDLLRPEADADERGDRGDTVTWLRAILEGEEGEPLSSAEIFKRAETELGVSQRTVQRARRSMGTEIVVERIGETGASRGAGRWVWRLDQGCHVPHRKAGTLEGGTIEEPYCHKDLPHLHLLRTPTHEDGVLDTLDPDYPPDPDTDPEGFERWAIGKEETT